jgi:hypothetical protein
VKVKSHLGDFACGDTAEEINALNCDHAAMYVSTRNQAGTMTEKFHTSYPKLMGSDHESSNTRKSNSLFFEFDDPAYAKRFAKAFVHAIEICGGKPSKFCHRNVRSS